MWFDAYYMMKLAHLLKKPTSQRTQEDIDALFSYLHSYEALSSLSEAALRSLCYSIRYERHPANSLVFRLHDSITCWYILLSGSVFIDGRMYIADDCFGKRNSGELLRPNDCIVSEPSEMMVIDYSDGGKLYLDQFDHDHIYGKEEHGYLASSASVPYLYSHNQYLHQSDSNLYDQNFDAEVMGSLPFRQNGQGLDQCFLGSKASDSSSLCSGSDVMLSSIDEQPIDLTGLIESIVDSDDDDDDDDDDENFGEHTTEEEFLPVHDAFHECLNKSPEERTDRDIELILENIQHLPAFNNITLATRQALCGVMRYAAIDALDTVVMTDGEQLDSWSVILNGEVETIHPDGSVKILKQGESFGLVTPTVEKVYHQGIMHTKVNNCQFLCVTQDDYCRIMQKGEENIETIKEDNKVVLVTEERIIDDHRKTRVIIRGTPEKLLDQLMLRLSSVDPKYIEDFLLTYRTFFNSPLAIAHKLLEWFQNAMYREQVVSVVLEWMNSHYSDFETEPRMIDFLEQLQQGLEELGLIQQLKLLSMTCTLKAKPRTVILNRTERKEILHFSVLGGTERGYGIYISKVEKGSKAYEIGLKRGDQILEVNNRNFERISHNQALEILRSCTHLSLTVKSNLLGFKEMLSVPSISGSRKEGKTQKLPLSHISSEPHSKPNSAKSKPIIRESREEERVSYLSGGSKNKLRQALMKLNIFPRSMNSEASLSHTASHARSSSGGSSPLIRTRFSSSHPDLSTLKLCSDTMVTSFPDHVLKIFQDDQSFKYLMVFKETTAREVVMLALQEFGITTPASSNYSLCEVTVVEEGFVKQRRLPDQLSDLANRGNFSSRYYLKCNDRTNPLIPDEIIGDVLRESQTNFLLLDCAEIAAQLTIKDFQMFRDIQPAEYVVDLFKCHSIYGTPNLTKFSQLSNSEMFWVVTQICGETNLSKRVKTMKNFIQIAKHCQECKNFNSSFAIISGLGHGSVQRLKQTWDKLPSKYLRLFEDLQKLMDPSRNMSKYRALINSESSHPPLVPFFPLVKKDLTFIHLGNDSIIDGFVNFEKLRMIAKEVRHVCSMASIHCDVNTSINASAAALHRKKFSGTLQSNPRKMYEETHMVRRVRAYLSSYKPIEDETVLSDMSNHCEQPVAFGLLARKPEAGNSPVILTKQTINLASKFGADSPEAVHKLLLLSDRVRPHENRKPRRPVLTSSLQPVKYPSNQMPPHSVTFHAPENSSLFGQNQQEHQSSVVKDLTAGSSSNSPTSSIGSNTGKCLVQTSQPQRSESDSGHNSSSNCDSNSISSVGSAGSPISTKVKPRESSMHQCGHSLNQTSGSLQQSRSIFYVSSTCDLTQASRTIQSSSYEVPALHLTHARFAEHQSGAKVRSREHGCDSNQEALKEAPTHRRANSSPLRVGHVKPEDELKVNDEAAEENDNDKDAL